MGRPIVHWEITGGDGKQLQQFYGEIFEWQVDANNPMSYGLAETGGPVNGGIGPGVGCNRVTFYIEVDDPDSYLAKIEQSGGRVVMPTTEIPGFVTIAQFADPEGNVIGLIKA